MAGSRKRLLIWLCAAGLTFVSGLLHGRMSQRWGADERMLAAARSLTLFPTEFGSWRQEESFELRPSAIELLACQGYISRTYRHQKTGDTIKLALMVGPGARMSIHVPEICFEANNFSLLESRRQYEIRSGSLTHQFWGVLFQLNDVSQQRLRVLYGWSDGGAWQAPQFPRWSVAGEPVLYKMQLSYAMPASGTATRTPDDVLADFLQHVVKAFAAGNAQPDVTR